ncbi:Aldolase-type TIM barrel [Penicillium lividum]|nr:Aldolase-type TIM barrel [Penicillium lividum]
MALQKHLLQKWFPHTSTPFIANAPMFGFADAHLAAAVTKAGGLELGTIPSNNLSIGVGFITFKPTGFVENVIPLLQSHRLAAVWLSFPEFDADHLPLIEGLRQAREKSNWDVKIFVQTGTVAAAMEAVNQGADVVVVQGSDAGGHQWAQGASLISLVPEVRDSLVEAGVASHTAILAAGGIVDGRGCVAALGLAPALIKQAILSGSDGGTSTVKSIRHDVFQSTDVFPRQYDGRAVIGISYDESKSGASDEEIIQRYKDAMKNGEDYRRTVWAGASIGGIKEELSASDLIKGVQQEVKSVMNRLNSI